MPKKKQKPHEPNFYDFMRASIGDQPLAQRMLESDPAWLTAADSLGETAFHYIVIENYQDAARFLLEAGAEIDTRDMSRDTPLIHAADLGYRDMVTFLLERGAEIDARNEYLETALFKTARHGHVEICDALLAAGADGRVQNDDDEHLWDVALPRKKERVLAVLAQHGYWLPVQPSIFGQ